MLPPTLFTKLIDGSTALRDDLTRTGCGPTLATLSMDHQPWTADALLRLTGDLMSRVAVPARTELVSQGEFPSCVYVVASGFVLRKWVGDDGRERIVDLIAGPGLVGDEAIDPGIRALATAETLTESTVWRIDSPRMRRLVATDARVASEFATALLSSRQRAFSRIVANHLLPLEIRLAHLLLVLSPENADGSLAPIPTRLTREDLATLADAGRPQISTLMTKFQRRGLIKESAGRTQVLPEMKRHYPRESPPLGAATSSPRADTLGQTRSLQNRSGF